MPTRSKFQSVQFASVKHSSSRDFSEALDAAAILMIDDARSPVLDTTTVSHFALASSHSLRGTELSDIIPDLKLLKKKTASLVFL